MIQREEKKEMMYFGNSDWVKVHKSTVIYRFCGIRVFKRDYDFTADMAKGEGPVKGKPGEPKKMPGFTK